MQQEVVTVGLDLAKNVFQLHAIGTDGVVLVRRKECEWRFNYRPIGNMQATLTQWPFK